MSFRKGRWQRGKGTEEDRKLAQGRNLSPSEQLSVPFLGSNADFKKEKLVEHFVWVALTRPPSPSRVQKRSHDPGLAN